MCLILFSWRQRADYPLVLAANRDEFYDRPTAPAAFWPETPQLLAGRDLVGGGAWLGMTRGGRLAAITNFRAPDEKRPGAPSRGRLVRDFLAGDLPVTDFLRQLDRRAGDYSGFNLLVGDGRQLGYYASRTRQGRILPPGLYGLSNHLLDTPWPKVTTGKAALAKVLGAPEIDPQALFALLADPARARDDLLPDTGIGRDWERLLSSRFIAGATYGTRASTLLLIDAAKRATFLERTFHPGDAASEVRRRFQTS
ncbi:MAG: NRDE family protein [Desulfuromonadales bacterium]